MPASRLFTRDFTLMTVGQIISLFGNAILRFALSLHVLALTGSAAVFGGILALSMVPTALLSPLGGILADRMPRARIMVILDFSTCAFILLFDALFARSGNLAAVTLFMVLLSLIQAVYQPSVQARVPTLVAEERLTAANGVVLQVQALTGLLGPVLGGILMGFFGIYPILAVSAGCFFGSAVLELFLHIPFTPQPRTAPLLIQARDDLAVAFRFLSRDYPALLRLLGIVALINLFLSSLFTVGLPYLVKVHLGLSDQLYGLAEAALGLGSILGGLLSATTVGQIRFESSHRYLLCNALLLLPVTVALVLPVPPLVSYGALLLCMGLGLTCAALFTISAQTFLQMQTPAPLLGKVGALVTTVSVCAMPAGQALYGALFDVLAPAPWLAVLLGGGATFLLALAARGALSRSVRIA